MAWFHCKNCYRVFERETMYDGEIAICPACGSRWNVYVEKPPDTSKHFPDPEQKGKEDGKS